jgi:hypothetical protein
MSWHNLFPLFLVLPQAEERENEEDHDDQTDEINESVHVPFREVGLSSDPDTKRP